MHTDVSQRTTPDVVKSPPSSRPAVIRPSRADIDFARGVACFLIVLFHIFGGRVENGLNIADDSAIRDFLNIFSFVRMPLFAFISGYVYQFKPVQPGMATSFIVNKFERIVVPCMIVATVFYLLQDAMGQRDVSLPMWQIYFIKYEIFWFIQAIFLLFVIVGIGDSRRLFETPLSLIALGVLPLVIAPYLSWVELFSIGGAVFLGPSFIAGILVHRFGKVTNRDLAVLAMLLACAMIVHAANVLALPDGEQPVRETLLALVIGGASSTLIMFKAPTSAIVSRVGQSSFAIFLFHIFFISAARKVIEVLDWQFLPMQIVVGLAVGIGGPLVVEKIVVRIPYLRVVLQGVRLMPGKRRAAL